jgi:AraC family transcriptional activator of tynA and feaB
MWCSLAPSTSGKGHFVLTEHLGAQSGEARELYRDTVNSLFGAIRVEFDTTHALSERMDMGTLADVTVTRSRCSSDVSCYRESIGIRRCFREVIDLVSVRAGTCTLIQLGNEVRLAPGDSALLVSTWPYEMHKSGHCEVSGIAVPLQRLRHWFRRPELIVARSVAGGRIVADLAEHLAMFTDSTADGYLTKGAESVIWALDVMMHDLVRASAHAAQRTTALATLARAKAHALGCLDSLELNRSEMAKAGGISVRQLNRLFANTGQSVTEFIRTARLKRAAEMLADLAYIGMTIQEVALACGYADQAKFSRHFKQRYGRTPTEHRANGGLAVALPPPL